MERIWLFWGSTRASGGDIFFAAIAPRIGPEPRLNGIARSGNTAGLAPSVMQQTLAQAALLERRRPFTVPRVFRRGPYLPGTVPSRRAGGR